MRVCDLYEVTIHLLKKNLKETPNKSYKNKEGEQVTLEEIIEQLTLLYGWVFPELTTDDISKVTRCKKCKHYKRYKKKDSVKSKVVYLCELDKKPRDPYFFCRDGDDEE